MAKIIEDVKSGSRTDKYCLSKGVLCTTDKAGKPYRIYLPKAVRDMVFKYFHDSLMGGHLGFFKTKNKICNQFFWPGCHNDVKRMVRRCDVCQMSKPARNTKIGLLSSSVPSRPMEKIHIDYVGKLPRSRKGNRFILVAVDAFSKFCWLCPCLLYTSRCV